MKRALIWSGALLLALLLVSEISLRILTSRDSQWNVRLGANKRFDPVTFFRVKSNADYGGGVSTNESGFLAPRNLSHERPEGELRIIYLGDSASYQPVHDNYPRQVERLLEAKGIPVQTVNAAVPGFASENALALLENEVTKYDADFFFVYLGWNDLGQYGPEGLPYKKRQAGYEISTAQRVLSQFYTPRLAFALIRLVQRYEETVNQPLTAEEEALYAEYYPHHYEENLRQILSLAKRRWDHVYVSNLATITSDDPTAEEMRTAHFPIGMSKNVRKLHHLVTVYNRVIEEVAASENVPMIDLFSAFDSREARREFTDSAHMNPDGTRRMAELTIRAIEASRRSP